MKGQRGWKQRKACSLKRCCPTKDTINSYISILSEPRGSNIWPRDQIWPDNLYHSAPSAAHGSCCSGAPGPDCPPHGNGGSGSRALLHSPVAVAVPGPCRTALEELKQDCATHGTHSRSRMQVSLLVHEAHEFDTPGLNTTTLLSTTVLVLFEHVSPEVPAFSKGKVLEIIKPSSSLRT